MVWARVEARRGGLVAFGAARASGRARLSPARWAFTRSCQLHSFLLADPNRGSFRCEELMKTTKLLLILSLVFSVAPRLGASDLRTACGDNPKSQTQTITSGNQTYTIHMGGCLDGDMTRDPVGYWGYDQFWEPNLYVRMENVGDVPVVNPWLRRADRPDTRSLQSIVNFVVQPSMSDKEKAHRLSAFEIHNRFHATTQDDEVNDVVKRFNCYGYTLCYNESVILSDLWRTAGLKVRQGYPNGHSTAEVFYNGAWHFYDSDESAICLLPDNKTVASEEQIVEDHWPMKRTHIYGPLHDDDPDAG